MPKSLDQCFDESSLSNIKKVVLISIRLIFSIQFVCNNCMQVVRKFLNLKLNSEWNLFKKFIQCTRVVKRLEKTQ